MPTGVSGPVPDTPLVPPLEPWCGSWVAYDFQGKVMLETFSESTAVQLAEMGHKVVTAMQHLASLNEAGAEQAA